MTQHYLFAHRVLASLMQSDGGAFEKALIEQGQPLLRRLWIHAGCHASEKYEGEPSFFMHQLSSTHEALVVQLPTPLKPPEAHFVALVRSPGKEAAVYTLELGQGQNFLCGWKGSTHANMGDGPEAQREPFLEALRKLVAV